METVQGRATAGPSAILLYLNAKSWYPRQESNLRTWFRKPLLYPLSYGGTW